MLQIKKLNLTHKKDLRIILNDFNLVLNDGDKAVIIGEEGNGKSTLMKWIYNPSLVRHCQQRIFVGSRRYTELCCPVCKNLFDFPEGR